MKTLYLLTSMLMLILGLLGFYFKDYGESLQYFVLYILLVDLYKQQ